MKKFSLLLLLFFTITSLVQSANVYFDYPVDGQHYFGAVDYHIHTVSFYYVVDAYQARIQFPDGHYSAWQMDKAEVGYCLMPVLITLKEGYM